LQELKEDSTATVIGAMIIAPLMTPILATTTALMMGNGVRAWRSLMLVGAGVLGVIVVAAALGIVAVHVVAFDTNSQITARVSPRLLDLIIALAAGTAGAFATSRDDIADSLSGVAISIALVPEGNRLRLYECKWNDDSGRPPKNVDRLKSRCLVKRTSVRSQPSRTRRRKHALATHSV